MKLTDNKVIHYINKIKPHRFPEDMLIGWLSELDGQIFEEIIKPREGAVITEFVRYESGENVLLVDDPYAMDLYSSYLKTRIDQEYGETEKYNLNAELFEAALQNFRNWYCSTHPLKKVRWHFSF